jgi:preprotein translocase subunit SecG
VSYLLVIFGPLAVIFFFAAIILNIKMNRKEEQFKNDLKKLENPDLV